MRQIQLTILFLALGTGALAQTNMITGQVIDKASKQPIEAATVQVLKNADSTGVAATVTDKRGRFSLETFPPGQYIFQCSFIGYQITNIQLNIAAGQSRISVGVIEIGLSSSSMEAVTVTTRKSMLNTSIDRKVYNVSQDIMANTGNASDILKNIPSVEVDIEGEVSLRGSADVLILINGRPSPLMGSSRAEALQQLPANSIERIEVITNPSAKYRPDGTSGIINIVLKKNTKTGLNGNATVSAGNRGRYNAGLTLNYKPGKINLFANYNYRKDRRIRENFIERIYPDRFYDEVSHMVARPFSHFVSGGFDFEANDRNSFGVSTNFSWRKMTREDFSHRMEYNNARALILGYDRIRFTPDRDVERNLTAYWQHQFKKEDHELRMELNVSGEMEVEDNLNRDEYFFPTSRTSLDNTFIRQPENQQQLSIDYSNPLTEDSKLEAGYLGSFIQQDLDFYGEFFDTAQSKFVKDVVRSNRFLFNQSVHAFYTSYQRSYGKFGYSAGLRFEQTIIEGNLITKDSLIDNKYGKLFPTMHLSYELENGELQLNYSKRVNRPDADELNPFPEYQDPRNLFAGNPQLRPEIIHSFEFGYKWQNKNYSFVPSIYYRHKVDGFTSVTIPLNDSTLLTTDQNLSKDQSAGLELIFSARTGSFMTTNLSTNFFYNKIDATELGYSDQKGIVAMSMNFNSTFSLSKTTMLQLSANYRSTRLTPQGKQYGRFVMNGGLRQDLFKEKVSLTLTASDIFKTLRQKSYLNTPFVQQTFVGRRDGSIIYLGLSFKFGKTFKKEEESLQFDENL